MKLVNLISTLMLTSLLSLPIMTLAEASQTPIERLVEELAEKPEHHVAIARYYRDKAAEAQKELAHHRAMRKAYESSSFNPKNPTNPISMLAHCDRLISQYEVAVTEYEQLAAEHEKMAK